jgi:hypothetical protein
MLSERFTENPYELAGLADLPEDDEALKASLAFLRNWIEARSLLSTEELALVMFVLVRVAQSDYQEGSYWPHLSERLGLANLSPQEQGRLGDWFRKGLRRFNYFVPTIKKAQRNLTPILVHAGIPRGSMEGLVPFVAIELERHGIWLANPAESAPDLIRQLVRAYSGPLLHRNVRRILLSNRRGAVELWSSLARVILAPIDSFDSEETLRLLPPGVDQQAVREAVRRNATIGVYRQPLRPPHLRYDRETGSVRLHLPYGSEEDWDVQAGECRYVWDQANGVVTAEFLDPLPEEVSIHPRSPAEGIGRAFDTRPERWPGLWFRASTGNLEQGTTIDHSGVEPGRWFVLFEGTPDEPGNAEPRPLNWPFFGSPSWSAWEVDVPARSNDLRNFLWRIGENEFTVPLGRHPGPTVRITAPILHASSGENDRFAVHGEYPAVILDRDRPCGAQLWRRVQDHWEPGRKLELRPDQQTLLIVERAGLYRLRETQGMGRVLAEFAFIPGLNIQGPTVHGDIAVIRISADADAGAITRSEDLGTTAVSSERPGSWNATISTIEPKLTIVWTWHDRKTPDLLFHWAIPGFRWRVVGLRGDSPKWTRDLLVVDEARVASEDPQLEIHVPEGSSLAINGENASLKPGPAGFRAIRSLNAYVGGVVRLTRLAADYDAVLVTRRPVVDKFAVEFDEETVIAIWSPTPPEGTVLLAWDPLSPTKPPKVIRLSSDELSEPGEWVGTWEMLPQTDYIAIALARRHSSAGLSLVPCYVLAVERHEQRKAVISLCERHNRADHITRLWSRFALDILVDLCSPRPRGTIDIAAWLEQIQLVGPLPLRTILTFASDLEKSPLLRAANREWVRRYVEEIRSCANSPIMLESWVGSAYPQDDEDNPPGVGWLLRNGIHPGWVHVECLPDRTDLLDSLTIPLKYYRDLRLLTPRSIEASICTPSTSPAVPRSPSRDDRLRAAKRVFSFHKIWQLPSPELFLPWRCGVIRVPDRDPRCSRELVFKLPTTGGETQFLDELGLNGLMIDAFDPQRREKFALTWEPDDENGWAIEPHAHQRLTPGWRTGTTPLLGPSADAVRLAERLRLKELLFRWAPKVDTSKELRDVLPTEKIDQFLKSEPASGALHSLVLAPPSSVEKLLRGVKIAVQVDRSIPDVVLTAWRISWVDRLGAKFGPGRLLGPSGVLTIDQAQYLGVLAMMLERYEDLMTPMFALTELLVRTLYDGGIGFAGKYAAGSR